MKPNSQEKSVQVGLTQANRPPRNPVRFKLPLWLPWGDPEYAGFNRVELSRARAAGLRTRSLRDTVSAVLDEGQPAPDDKRRAGKLTREKEAQLLATWAGASVGH